MITMAKLQIREVNENDYIEINKAFKSVIFPYTGDSKLKFNFKWYEVGVVAIKNGRVVVFCYTNKETETSRTRKTAYIGYFVIPTNQNKGIGTKVVKEMMNILQTRGFVRVECDMAEENITSIKLAESLGFQFEGRLKKCFLTDDGRFIDDLLYGFIFPRRQP